MTKAEPKAKKLPDVWVKFASYPPVAVGVIEAVAKRRFPTSIRYTPAKPAKVCVWTERGELWDNCEGVWYGEEPYKFCPLCGGKVKR